MATILIVDDDKQPRTLLRVILELSDYQVIEAADGQQALDIMAQQPCDGIVTDWDMPVMDGLTLAQRVRAERPDFPILIVSGELSEERRGLLKAQQITALEKPYSSKRLICLMAVLLS